MQTLKQRPIRMNKWFFVGSYITAIILTFCISSGFFFKSDPSAAQEQIVAIRKIQLSLVNIFGSYATMVTFILYYCMWKAIDDNTSRISPILRSLLNHIPFVKTIWIWFTVAAYPRAYEKYCCRNGLRKQKMLTWLFWLFAVTSCIGFLFSNWAQLSPLSCKNILTANQTLSKILAYISWTAFVSNLIFAALAWHVCDIVNRLPSAKESTEVMESV